MALQKLSITLLLLGMLVSLGACGGSYRERHDRHHHGHHGTECKQKPEERPASVDLSVDYENANKITVIENGQQVVYCAHGCCWGDCCSDDGDSFDHDPWGDFDRDDHDHREGENALRIIVPVVLAVGGLVVVIAVTVCLIKRRKRARQQVADAISTDYKGPMAEAGMYPSGKQPLPDYNVDSKTPPAMFVTAVAPPAYDVVNKGHEEATAPPTYSSLNLQEAAKDNVPAPLDKEKEVPIA